MHYQLRPVQIEEVTIELQLEDDDRNTAYDKYVELNALESAGAILMNDDFWGRTGFYVRVKSVTLPPEVKQGGGSPDRPKEGQVYIATMVYHQWLNSGQGLVP